MEYTPISIDGILPITRAMRLPHSFYEEHVVQSTQFFRHELLGAPLKVVNTAGGYPLDSNYGVGYLLSRKPEHAMLLAKCVEHDGKVTVFAKEELPGSRLASKSNINDP